MTDALTHPRCRRPPRPHDAVVRATTRSRSSQAAVELFIAHGYDATSVAAVAERLGLTKSALYHHYESKEQLLGIALDEALGGLEGVLDEPGARTRHAGRAARARAARRGARAASTGCPT